MPVSIAARCTESHASASVFAVKVSGGVHAIPVGVEVARLVTTGGELAERAEAAARASVFPAMSRRKRSVTVSTPSRSTYAACTGYAARAAPVSASPSLAASAAVSAIPRVILPPTVTVVSTCWATTSKST